MSLLTHLNVVRGFQCSFSYCNSSGARSLPNAVACGLVVGDQIMIIPSVVRGQCTMTCSIARYTPSPADAMSSPVFAFEDKTTRVFRVECIPLGLHLTTLTGAECLLSVARYSTLGGRGVAPSEPEAATTDSGRMFGCTIHNYRSCWSDQQAKSTCQRTLTWLSSPPVASR